MDSGREGGGLKTCRNVRTSFMDDPVMAYVSLLMADDLSLNISQE